MDNREKRKSRFFLGFVIGFMLGALGLAVAPQWWRSYVPEAFFPGGVVHGVVAEKSTDSKRLLLKLETSDGVLLATFTERLEEIDLLVEDGDEVSLRLPRYEPFVTDPRLERVRKPERKEEAGTEDAEPVEPSPVEQPLEDVEPPPKDTPTEREPTVHSGALTLPDEE